jgi:methylglyoxal synthase
MGKTVTQLQTCDEPGPRVALIAHNACKDEMTRWAILHLDILKRCGVLYATATTGKRVSDIIGLPVELLLSGPLGGDAEVGAMIAENQLDAVIFFCDPLTAQPHDVDVRMLMRLAILHNVPIACNRSSADLFVSSPLFVKQRYLAEQWRATFQPFAPAATE